MEDILKKQLLVGMVGATLLLGACGNGSTGNNSAEKRCYVWRNFNKGKKFHLRLRINQIMMITNQLKIVM